MWSILRRARLTHRLPSEIIGLSIEKIETPDLHPLANPEAIIWAFDEAILDFGDWYDAKEAERKKEKLAESEKLRDGEHWAPVYRSVEAIVQLAEENKDEWRAYEAGELAESLDPDELQAVIAAANAVDDGEALW